jgi:KTSC domain-containing protein
MTHGLDRKRAEEALRRAAHKAVHGTREERSGRVSSSVIAELTYHPGSRDLDVRFTTGKIYRYSNVPQNVYDDFLRAVSKGTFFNTRVRDAYSFQESLS